MDKTVKRIIVLLVLLFPACIFLFVINNMPNGFIFGIPLFLFFIPLVCAFLWMIYICTRFAAKIKELHRNPCQETADALLGLMQDWGNFTHLLLRSNMIKFGVKSAMIRETYNRGVYPNRQIAIPTKQRLYLHFIRLNIWDLREPSFPAKTTQTAQPAGNSDDHGKLGEENVWRTIKDLPNLGQFDVFFDVNIAGSQIDAVVVAQNGGVFLMEVKSWGGQYVTTPRNEEEKRKMVKIVSYDLTNPDMIRVPGQLAHHRSSFNRVFSGLQLSDRQIHDVLVISYPYNDTVRVVDANSFPEDYRVVAVHDLTNWLPKQTAPALTAAQRQQLVTVFGQNSQKKCIHRAQPAPAQAPQNPQPAPEVIPAAPVVVPATPVVEQSASGPRFCPYCGQQLTSNSKFCMSCGQKV